MNDQIPIVSILGAGGRMGMQLVRMMDDGGALQLGDAIVSPDSRHLGVDSGRLSGGPDNGVLCISELQSAADVVVDFTTADGIQHHLDRCIAMNAALVSGATGISKAAEDSLRRAASQIPVLLAANTSVGVAVLRQLVATAARALPDADIEIVETHHRFKRDAPSGTALALAKSAADARGVALEQSMVPGRAGAEALRATGDIGISAIRGGDVAGEHTVSLLLDGERLELTHRASSRKIFARGALRLAKRLAGKPPGWYQVEDLL